MSTDTQTYASQHYGPLANDYVQSTVHSSGIDLDLIEHHIAGRGLGTVLDLGCGGGHVSYRAAPLVRGVVACDITQTMLDAVHVEAQKRGLRNITTCQAAAEKLPFPTASFDAVLCRFTAHHWLDLEAGLREARRVLKPDHPAIFVDVTAPANTLADSWLQTIELLRDLSHVRDYSVHEWVSALERTGFSLSGIKHHILQMEFSSWTSRSKTPNRRKGIIHEIQKKSPEFIQNYFSIKDNGDFNLKVSSFILE
ncbi:class I SAM-dependent methyltransferase [Gluconobacter wancherniae]|uniref:class I SAM-dependent methyltransferase n=1 Tax=Gluconobacter wancherniae TaxID=1307955 RepID=UPI001B8AEB5C|nr:class I SAM-dependent methyltransferase [Gluconobacter wancherniae]MBS1095070.1 class I SAM-dependent methyltransferase [Gluconobacter wancherniae]